MTFTLAFDTATDVASIAVARDGALAAELTLPGRRHAAVLLPGIEQALSVAGGTLRDVGRILCADGPGSFTGLRIGFATAQGIVRGGAGGSATVGTMPSLLAAAWTAAQWTHGPVAVAYDALRGDVYGAVYRIGEGSVETLVAPVVLPFADLVTRSSERPSLVAADPGVAPDDLVREWCGCGPVTMRSGPRAAALLALDGVAGGIRDVEDVMVFAPEYGRPAEAQAKWERVHGRALPDSGGEYR